MVHQCTRVTSLDEDGVATRSRLLGCASAGSVCLRFLVLRRKGFPDGVHPTVHGGESFFSLGVARLCSVSGATKKRSGHQHEVVARAHST